jgi:transposase-like protein
MTKREQRPVATPESEIIRAIPAACADEAAAVEFIERLRWADCPACPRCGDVNVAQMLGREGQRNARYLWRCHGCKRQFTVRIGTIFEDSRIPLRVWCYAFWRSCSSKKGISALQVSRETGITHKSALFLLHRIRFSMATEPGPRKLEGTVEADETYVGGKPRKNRPYADRWKRNPNKAPVMAIVERGGEVRARPLDRVTAVNVRAAIHEYVAPTAKLYTDEGTHYRWADKPWPGGHKAVNHSLGEYARGDVTTNRVESFFSLVKRGMYGTWHSVSKKHLGRYVNEFEFRFNTRNENDGERTLRAIQAADDKRLTYREHIGPTGHPKGT